MPSQKELLALIPPGTKCVQVINELGQKKYKNPADVIDTDVIQINNKGLPVVTKDRPGRPKKKIEFDKIDPVAISTLKRKEEAVVIDPILAAIRTNPESANVLEQIMIGLTAEASRIDFDRQEADRRGEDTGVLSQRRIQALKAIGDTWLKRKEQLTENEIDITSPAFKSLFGFIMECFRNAMDSCEVRSELTETVFAKFAQIISDESWESEARNRMKEKKQ